MEAVAIFVQTASDIGHARRKAVHAANDIGFNDKAVDEIAIVTTELATNLVRHRTIHGKIIISSCERDGGTGIEILAKDRGPGIAAPHIATMDHWSSNGTSGCGLGAVKRLMDEFEIQSRHSPEAMETETSKIGTRITARKWLTLDRPPPKFVFSANSRPYLGETANGDSFFVREDEAGLLVAVVDGLGHGPEAAIASNAAVAYVRENPDRELQDIQRNLHRILSATRGAAVTLARIDFAEQHLTHIGIGNVATRVYPVGPSQLVTSRGIVGMGVLPHLRVNSMPWPKDGTLIVYSDGLSDQWDPSDASLQWNENVTAIGNSLMRKLAKSNDDATVVVVREAR